MSVSLKPPVCVGSVSEQTIFTETTRFVADIPSGDALKKPEPPAVWSCPQVPGRAISHKDDFGADEEARPKRTDILITRVLPMRNDSKEGVAQLLGRVMHRAIFDELRGKLGATYSPRIISYCYPDLRVAGVQLKVRPDMEDTAVRACGQVVGGLSVCADEYRSLFEELKKASVERLQTADVSGEEITDDAVGQLRLYGRIRPITEGIADYAETEYEQVCALAEQEFATEKVHLCTIRP